MFIFSFVLMQYGLHSLPGKEYTFVGRLISQTVPDFMPIVPMSPPPGLVAGNMDSPTSAERD
jgi:hypothetical protein